MRNLLASDFTRLCKSKLLLFTILGFFLGAGYLLYIHYFLNPSNPYQDPIEETFFLFLIPLGFMLAVFCSLFLGTDYSDGTLRNKIIAGHSRTAIYFVNLFTCIFAGLLMSAAFLLPVCCVGLHVTGGFSLPKREVLLYLANSLLTVCAFSAAFTTICTLCTHKATAAIICLLCTAAFIVLSAMLCSALSVPEFYEEFASFDPLTEEVIFKQVPAVGYVGGIKREIYTFLIDLLPMGQAYQLAMCSAERLVRMAFCAVGFSAVTTVIGLFGFRRKNLK